jgi:hypothetical protein
MTKNEWGAAIINKKLTQKILGKRETLAFIPKTKNIRT